MRVTKNIYEANAITHNGAMHADEVFATVILDHVIPDLTVYRASGKVPEGLAPSVVVYDIGMGRFDHHQKGGNGRRPNDIPYASAGLIWREYGPKVCAETADQRLVWASLDKSLFQGIDAEDNGEIPRFDYPTKPASLSQVISGFNPVWDSDEDSDAAFAKAVEYASVIFQNAFETAASKARAKEKVHTAIDNANGHIMVLDRNLPFQSFLFHPDPWLREKADNIFFAIYPSQRGGYNWKTVLAKPNSSTPRWNTPSEWHGLGGDALRKLTGVETATFCHKAGFVGGAETLDDAISMAQKAIAAGNRGI